MIPVMRVENLGKRFRRYRPSRYRPLTDALKATWQRTAPDAFWVFRGVSFEVSPGEMVGIVGRNGAGKSTLLSLMAGLLRAEEGTIRLRGHVGALLDLGMSLHPLLTGRENIRTAGLFGGLTNKQVDDRIDQIVAFAGIDEFLDAPVRTYSSGMKARLAFSIATHADPDVLLIDEFLFVGDQFFQEACLERIRGLMRNGTAVLLSSHVAEKIATNCTRALWLDQGGLRAIGRPEEVLRRYQADVSPAAAARADQAS